MEEEIGLSGLWLEEKENHGELWENNPINNEELIPGSILRSIFLCLMRSGPHHTPISISDVFAHGHRNESVHDLVSDLTPTRSNTGL